MTWQMSRILGESRKEVLTWSQRAAMAWTRSTCRQRTAECRHTSCSSCRTYAGGSSPSGPSRSPGHPAPGQTPASKHAAQRGQLLFTSIVHIINFFASAAPK